MCIMAPSVMAGYYKNKKETDSILKKHEDGQWWIYTGDIGTFDDNGFLTIVGRMKRIIVLHPDVFYYKIFPKLLEEQIEVLPGVQSAIIVGSSTCPEDCTLVAFIVPDSANPVSENELRAFAAENFESYEHPVEYRFVVDLPRTQLSKIDYRALEHEE